jgi:hypothetical protein
MGLPRFTRRETAFVLGVPLAWAALLLLHPMGDGTNIYADLEENVGRMLIVHVGMLIFIPLFAVVIYMLLRGIESTAARVARIALIPFVVLYVAWEAMQGIANAVLTNEVNSLSGADQEVGANLIQDFAESPLVRDFGLLSVPASLALVIATVALGIALRDAGAPRSAPVLFGLAGFFISAHPPPFGPIGLLLFTATVTYIIRTQHLVEEPGVPPTSA